jgi:drug/metabolite transporter (DMT)-like permease
MEHWHVAVALLSAILHAGWNAVVKADARPTEIMTAQMVMAAILVVPGLMWTGLPNAASWPWIVLSTALNFVTVTSLLKAYDVVGFGVAYPVVRALSVLLVVPAAALIAGEMLSVWGLSGVTLMAIALALLGVSNASGAPVSSKAVGWIAVSGIATAAYVLCDARGVRLSDSPWAYGYAVSITNAMLMLGRQYAGGMNPVRLMTRHAAKALPIAVASVASYQLILLVWANAAVAPTAAIRDTSAIFAVLIAVFWLREPMTRARLLAVLCAAAAIPLLRFA